MATCTMAKVRYLGLLPTSLATRALVVTFQSVTTSAHAGATHSAAATMPDSRTDTGVLEIALMAGLLVWHQHRKPCVTLPPTSKIDYLYDWWHARIAGRSQMPTGRMPGASPREPDGRRSHTNSI